MGVLNVTPDSFSDGGALSNVDQVMHTARRMIHEGARILEEGIASRPVDIDVIFANGFGWPAWRGGPMFWADRMGLKAVRDKLAQYAEATNDPNLKPAPLIEKLAKDNGSFAGMKGAGKAA